MLARLGQVLCFVIIAGLPANAAVDAPVAWGCMFSKDQFPPTLQWYIQFRVDGDMLVDETNGRDGGRYMIVVNNETGIVATFGQDQPVLPTGQSLSGDVVIIRKSDGLFLRTLSFVNYQTPSGSDTFIETNRGQCELIN